MTGPAEEKTEQAFRILPGYEMPQVAASLFAEYNDLLAEREPGIRAYLATQHYDEELQHPERKYGMPEGRLFLAFCGDKAVGCGALRKMDKDTCEMKRLYVKKEYRRLGIGQALAERLIEEAREAGYRVMLLDSLEYLRAAVSLYEKLGFQRIESYNNNPLDQSVYMRLELR